MNIKPTPKVLAATGGAVGLTALVMWVLALAGVEIPETAAEWIATVALPGIGAIVLGWLKRDQSSPNPPADQPELRRADPRQTTRAGAVEDAEPPDRAARWERPPDSL